MNRVCLVALFCFVRLISMERPPTPAELELVKIALEKENVAYSPQITRVVKKPLMHNLFDVDNDDTRYLIDTRAQVVVNRYTISPRPATS